MNYNNSINTSDIQNIIDKINKINNDTNIIFDVELNKYFKLSYNKIDNDDKALYSFIEYEDNKKYNNKLLKHHNNIFKKIFEESKMYLYYIKNINELIYLKLYYAINWSKKYKFELKDINVININNDININILYNINKNLLYNDLYKFKLKINKNNHISKDTFYNKINKINNNHKLLTTFIDTRNKSVYRKIKLLFEPFYLKIKNIRINKKYKSYLNQPFFKLYEILHLFNLTNTTNTTNTKNKDFNTFHFCELPGSFIFSLKYFIETRTKLNFIWKA